MSEYKATAQEQKRAEQIRRQYMSRKENKMEQLQALDEKVKAPGRVVSIIIGAISALVLGAGMASIMVWHNMMLGLALGIPGLIVALLAYPLYVAITNSRKKKYAPEIIRLTDELINDK